MKTWIVTNAKTGAELGRIERRYTNMGDIKRPNWRVWYYLVGNDKVNADTRSTIAVYLGGDSKTKMTLTKAF
jgi:hypothetical protein